MPHQCPPLRRPAEIAHELARQAERKIESADPGARPGEQRFELAEALELLDLVNGERPAFEASGGHGDRLSRPRRAREVDAVDPQRRLSRDLVVTPAGELDEAKAVAERIGEEREAPVGVLLGRLLERCAGGGCALDGAIDIVDREIEVHRRPVAAVAAPFFRSGRGRRAFLFGKQVDRRAGAQELEPALEAPAHMQAEPVAVEARRAIELRDVDVDEKLHRAAASSAAERLWILPKPATKRASRGTIFQNEKSASSKLIACSGNLSSHAAFKAGLSAQSCCAS